MPKLKRGSGGRRHGCKAKQGTKNKHQVAARDERQAAAIAAVGIMADEALEGLLSSPQATEEEVLVSPLIEPACEPAKGELDAYKRMAIVSAYQRLKEASARMLCSGDRYRIIILRYIRFFAMYHPNMGTFSP